MVEDGFEGGPGAELNIGTAAEGYDENAREKTSAASGENAGAEGARGTCGRGTDDATVRAYGKAGHGGGSDRVNILRGAGRSHDFSAVVEVFPCLRIEVAGKRGERNYVTVGKGQRGDAHLEFGAAFEAPGTFGGDDFGTSEGAHGNDDAVVLGNGVGGLEIDGVTGLRGARANGILKDQRQARACRQSDHRRGRRLGVGSDSRMEGEKDLLLSPQNLRKYRDGRSQQQKNKVPWCDHVDHPE